MTRKTFSVWTAARDYISEMKNLGHRVRYEVDWRPTNPRPYTVIVKPDGN